MSMYFAPAFFAHLLGRSFQKRRPLLHVLKLGVTVIATFAVLWAPYLGSLEEILQVRQLDIISPLAFVLLRWEHDLVLALGEIFYRAIAVE